MSKRHDSHTARPNGISFRLVLLAFALLVAQPTHWMTCCLATMPDLHLASSAEVGIDEQKSHSGSPLYGVSHEQEDREATMHAAPESGVHHEEFVITPHCVRSHHHHAPCCSDCKAPALSQRSERLVAGADLLVPFESVSVPVFRLDILEGRCTRAGPLVSPLFSSHLVRPLAGRAPPFSA